MSAPAIAALGPYPETSDSPPPATARSLVRGGRLPPTALLIFSIVAVQLGSALATVLIAGIGPVGTTFTVALGSALVLTLYARPKPDRRLKRHLGLVVLFGVVNGVMALAFFLALARLPLGICATITFLGPLGLAVATSRRLLHFALIGIAGLGVALLAPEIGSSGVAGALDPLGLCYAAIAAVGWAAFVPLSKRLGAIFSGIDGLTYAFWIEAVLLLPVALAAGALDGLRWLDLASVFGVAMLSTVLPMALEYRALQRMSARTYGILVTLEPAVGAAVGVVCLGQPAGPRVLAAVGCVMLAALGITLSDRSDGGAP